MASTKDSSPELKDSHPELAEGLRYSEFGAGAPVLLLDWTPWQTGALGDALAKKYRVLTVEPPIDAGADGTVDDTAAAIAQAAEAAGLASYSLAGVSLGADVALRAALLRPASVATLALVSPLCVEPSPPRPWNTPELAASAMLAHAETASANLPDSGRTAILSALAERWRSAEGDAAGLLPRHPMRHAGGVRAGRPAGFPKRRRCVERAVAQLQRMLRL